jgi:hypothetical protein
LTATETHKCSRGAESFDEMKHAEVLTDRILFLDGLPNYQRLRRCHGQPVELLKRVSQVRIPPGDTLGGTPVSHLSLVPDRA